MKTTINANGEILLPPEIQTQLGLKPGDDVILETENGHCIIRPDDASVGLCWEGNVLVHRGVSKGVPGATLLQFAGTIDESDLQAMSQAIEAGCERVDADEW